MGGERGGPVRAVAEGCDLGFAWRKVSACEHIFAVLDWMVGTGIFVVDLSTHAAT